MGIDIHQFAHASLLPPTRIALSEWVEQNIKLPEGVSALPGPVRLWPYQHEIADAISDPCIERITLVRPVRVGFTTLQTGATGSFVANEPAPIPALLPTESDARDYMVSDIEPTFGASQGLRGTLTAGDDGGKQHVAFDPSRTFTVLDTCYLRRDRARPRSGFPARRYGPTMECYLGSPRRGNPLRLM